MKSGLFLNVVIRECASIFKLLACKDQALLVRRNALLILDFCFHVIDGVRSFDIKGDCLASQSLNKDLHASAETQDKMKSGLFLNVVIRECTSIFKLLACKDQAL